MSLSGHLSRTRWLAALFAALLCVPPAWMGGLGAGDPARRSPPVPVSAAEEEEDTEVETSPSLGGEGRRAAGRAHLPRRTRRKGGTSTRRCPSRALRAQAPQAVPVPTCREARFIVPRYGE